MDDGKDKLRALVYENDHLIAENNHLNRELDALQDKLSKQTWLAKGKGVNLEQSNQQIAEMQAQIQKLTDHKVLSERQAKLDAIELADVQAYNEETQEKMSTRARQLEQEKVKVENLKSLTKFNLGRWLISQIVMNAISKTRLPWQIEKRNCYMRFT